MRERFLRLLPVATVLGLLIAVSAPAVPAEAVTIPFPIPGGYTPSVANRVSAGVTHAVLKAASRRVSVVFVRNDATERLKVMISNERIAGGLETITSMCARMRCLAAVNGDFYSTGSAQPNGGIASRGIPYRTPSERYHLTQDAEGAIAIQQVEMISRLFVTYPDGTEPFFISRFNSGRVVNQAAIYTDRWAPSTLTGGGFEILLEPVDPAPTPQIGQTRRVRMIQGFAAGNSPIPAGKMVLSGDGSYATILQQLWSDVLAERASAVADLAVVTTPSNLMTFTAGNPPLLLGGQQAFQDNSSSLFAGHHARTLAGRNSAGDLILATVGDAAGNIGMTMVEAMEFMRSLGATDALNMDGGGSSTFLLRRWVGNALSDGRPRGVATGVSVVHPRWT